MKTDTEPKENNCKVVMQCTSKGDCAHEVNEAPNLCAGNCDYQDLNGYYTRCHSTVAQVNALTIRLQELTGKKVGLG